MRTTLNLDDHLVRQAKELALRTDRTLSAVIEDALRAAFSKKSPPPRLRIPSIDFGFPADLDLSNNAAVRDWADRQGADNGSA